MNSGYKQDIEEKFVSKGWTLTKDVQNCVMRCFMVYIAHQVLGWITQEARDRQDLKHA
jgi:hypothetical protein